jgi:hypothetical protein
MYSAPYTLSSHRTVTFSIQAALDFSPSIMYCSSLLTLAVFLTTSAYANLFKPDFFSDIDNADSRYVPLPTQPSNLASIPATCVVLENMLSSWTYLKTSLGEKLHQSRIGRGGVHCDGDFDFRSNLGEGWFDQDHLHRVT